MLTPFATLICGIGFLTLGLVIVFIGNCFAVDLEDSFAAMAEGEPVLSTAEDSPIENKSITNHDVTGGILRPLRSTYLE